MSSIHPHHTTFARIRRAGPGEIAELRAFAATLHHGPLPFDWATALSDGDHAAFVAFEGNTLCGAIAGYCDPARVTAELCWIGVSSSARRRGIGRLLLDHFGGEMRSRRAVDIAVPADAPDISALMLAAGARPRARHLHLALTSETSIAFPPGTRTTSHA